MTQMFPNSDNKTGESILHIDEWGVLDHLTDAYNNLIHLPIYFKNDKPDFTFHINALKSIVMSRAVEREELETKLILTDNEVAGSEE